MITPKNIQTIQFELDEISITTFKQIFINFVQMKTF